MLGVSAGQQIVGKDQDSDSADLPARCDQLLRAVPFVAEVTVASSGEIAVRQWAIRTDRGQTSWMILSSDASHPDGWDSDRSSQRFDFAPALAANVRAAGNEYVVSVASDPQSSFETEQLLSFMLAFSPPQGTYEWYGKRYQWSAVPKLPCFALATNNSR